MHVWMLYRDKEKGFGKGYYKKDDIVKDLNLDLIFKTMSRDNDFDESRTRNVGKEDSFIYETAKKCALHPLATKEEVEYRQGFVKEAVGNPDLFAGIYRIAAAAKGDVAKRKASEKENKARSDKKAGAVIQGMEMLQTLLAYWKELKEYLDGESPKFVSEQMKGFYQRFCEESRNGRFDRLNDTVQGIAFATQGGRLALRMSMGQGMKGGGFVISDMEKTGYRKAKTSFLPIPKEAKDLYVRLFKPNVVLLKDEQMIRDARCVEEEAALHALKFFEGFRKEYVQFFEELHEQSAFYLGCANLYHRLVKWKIPLCYPKVVDGGKELAFEGLNELSMSLLMRKRPVSNDLDGKDKWLFVVTGANQGGKSTFLRSVGIAQILMQCGMFVPAERYEGNLHGNLYTHFTRREDSTMNSGRLDEELRRMDDLIRTVKPDSLILLNESFATTTEKEGSLIAYDVTKALYEIGAKVLMVTHLYAFAARKYAEKPEHAVFLAAEREADGTRTFRMRVGEPTKTSYGLDLYDKIIGGRQDGT